MNSLIKIFTICVLWTLAPVFVSAQIIITEVMYDVEGSDSGREWIEIYNESDGDIDLVDWRLFEGGTNHKLKEVAGGTTLSAGGYAVIADDPDKFLADQTTFDGLILDSVFSLKNTGEEIAIRNPELEDLGTLLYDPLLGAAGDGNSLQFISGSWQALPPTPGKANSNSSEVDDENQDNIPVVEDEQEKEEENTVSYFPVEPQVFAYAGARKRLAVAGARIQFDGQAYGVKKEPLTSARFLWTFGDGASTEGEHVVHSFVYPGEYVVFLNASSGKFSGLDKVYVTAISADISISDANSEYIEIANNTKYELDLSYWQLKAGNKVFTFPDGTYILAQKQVRFPKETTGLRAYNNSDAVLLYPNGVVVKTQNEEEGADTNIVQPAIVNTSQNIQAENLQETAVPETNSNIGKSYRVFANKVEFGQIQSTEEADAEMPMKEDVLKQQSSALEAISYEDTNTKEGGITLWLLGVLGILMVGISGVFMAQSAKTEADLSRRSGAEADEYEIIEEKESDKIPF